MARALGKVNEIAFGNGEISTETVAPEVDRINGVNGAMPISVDESGGRRQKRERESP